jgi:hypothetical protein
MRERFGFLSCISSIYESGVELKVEFHTGAEKSASKTKTYIASTKYALAPLPSSPLALNHDTLTCNPGVEDSSSSRLWRSVG